MNKKKIARILLLPNFGSLKKDYEHHKSVVNDIKDVIDTPVEETESIIDSMNDAEAWAYQVKKLQLTPQDILNQARRRQQLSVIGAALSIGGIIWWIGSQNIMDILAGFAIFSTGYLLFFVQSYRLYQFRQRALVNPATYINAVFKHPRELLPSLPR